MTDEKKKRRHWPAIIIVAACAIVFLISSMTYTVSNSEYVIVKRFESFKEVSKPGLNFKFPYPVEDIVRIDSRLQHYERPLTQTALSDVRNLLVSVTAGWKVDENKVREFHNSVTSISDAGRVIKNIIGTPTGNVFPKYKLDEIFNTDPKENKLDRIKEEIHKEAQEIASQYGIKIVYIGFSQIAFSPSSTKTVMERMRSSRKSIATEIRTKGEAKAQEIIRNAEKVARSKEEEAKIEAERIRSLADLEAQEIYKNFENPDLVAFLRQLESLKKLLNKNTQMVLDLDTPPFNLLKGDLLEELKNKPGKNK